MDKNTHHKTQQNTTQCKPQIEIQKLSSCMSRVAPEIVVTTTYAASNGDKDGIITIIRFRCRYNSSGVNMVLSVDMESDEI